MAELWDKSAVDPREDPVLPTTPTSPVKREQEKYLDSSDGPRQTSQPTVRQLTAGEQAHLEKDIQLVSDFKQQKLEKEAKKNWDLFYKRNTTKFFKDRHWTTREFAELCGNQASGPGLRLLEVGCGVGNFIFPLLKELPTSFFYACDFSPRAVDFVKAHPEYTEARCCAFQADLTQDPLTAHVPAHSLDIVSMIFVLSAIHPDKMLAALKNIASVLRPGGCVLFRDYGLYDHAQLRFAPGHKLMDNFYVRQDGTRAYYFSTELLGEMFKEAGFEEAAMAYVVRETVNKKEGLCVPRVFVQAKFVLPVASVGAGGEASLSADTHSAQSGQCTQAQSQQDCDTDTNRELNLSHSLDTVLNLEKDKSCAKRTDTLSINIRHDNGSNSSDNDTVHHIAS